MRAGRRWSLALALVAVVALALAGCGGSKPSNEVDMGVAAFEQSAVTIKTGQAVHFVDPNTGGVHILCVGKGTQCIPAPGAPDLLNTKEGWQVQAGDTRDVTFPTAGTYVIVCIIHPGMQVTVTVTS
ncbi:MAG TPA: plastocyanin/azurin family copper-binding protein [Ktedonobacterales bacterium]